MKDKELIKAEQVDAMAMEIMDDPKYDSPVQMLAAAFSITEEELRETFNVVKPEGADYEQISMVRPFLGPHFSPTEIAQWREAHPTPAPETPKPQVPMSDLL